MNPFIDSMPERISPQDYFESEATEEIPYIIPMPVWIILGMAVLGLIIIAVYSISKN